MRKTATLLLFCALAAHAPLAAQRTELRFKATVRSWDRDSAVKEIAVTATDSTTHTLKASCRSNGRCRMKLPLDQVYRVDLSAAGHVPQHMLLDLKGPTIKQRKWGYDLRVKVDLMPRVEKLDYAVCEQALGKAHFDPKLNQFTWDEDHTAGLMLAYEALRVAYDDDKARRDAEKKALRSGGPPPVQ